MHRTLLIISILPTSVTKIIQYLTSKYITVILYLPVLSSLCFFLKGISFESAYHHRFTFCTALFWSTKCMLYFLPVPLCTPHPQPYFNIHSYRQYKLEPRGPWLSSYLGCYPSQRQATMALAFLSQSFCLFIAGICSPTLASSYTPLWDTPLCTHCPGALLRCCYMTMDSAIAACITRRCLHLPVHHLTNVWYNVRVLQLLYDTGKSN